MTTRQALAIGHKLRLLGKVIVHPAGDLSVPCPHPGCPTTLHVWPEREGWPLTIGGTEACRHLWALAHRECVEVVVGDYLGWYAERVGEELPF